MENQKRFDLEQSLTQWRSTLENSPAIRSSDMEELEAHLRDSIQTLQSKGLGAEEAFLIACRRLGPSRELDREYGKANQRQVWLDRIMWLAVGLMLHLWIQHSAHIIASLISGYAYHWNAGAQSAGLLGMAINLLVHGAAWLVVFRLVTRYLNCTAGWIQFCLRNPLLPLVAIIALNLNQVTLGYWITGLLFLPKFQLAAGDGAILSSWHSLGEIVTNLGYIIAFVCLVYGYMRSLGESSSEPSTEASQPSFLSPDILALQNVGLSNQEATLLVQRRQNKDTAGFQMENSCVCRTWMERLIWMIAAVVIFRCFVSQIQFAAGLMTLHIPSWILPSWILVSGHSLGAIGVLLQSALILSLAVIAWRVTTRPIKVIPWFAGVFVKWPLAGALGLLCLTIGGYWYFFICLKHFSVDFHTSVDFRSDPVKEILTYWEWQMYGNRFWLDVLPVLFVFWLGRQRLNLTVKELFVFRRN